MKTKNISLLIAISFLIPTQSLHAESKLSFTKGFALGLSTGATIGALAVALFHHFFKKNKPEINSNPVITVPATPQQPVQPIASAQQPINHQAPTNNSGNVTTTNTKASSSNRKPTSCGDLTDAELLRIAQQMSLEEEQQQYNPAEHDGVRAPIAPVRQILANDSSLPAEQRIQADRINAKNARLAALEAEQAQAQLRQQQEEEAFQAALALSVQVAQAAQQNTHKNEPHVVIDISGDNNDGEEKEQSLENTRQARLKHFDKKTSAA